MAIDILQSELANRVPQNPPAITTIEPAKDAIALQQGVNSAKMVQAPQMASGGAPYGMMGYEESYDADDKSNISRNVDTSALSPSAGYANALPTSVASNTVQNAEYLNNTPEWVRQTAIANQVLTAAGLASKGYYGTDSRITQGLGTAGNVTGGLLTAYSAYKAATGTSDEKTQAYQSLGQQAVGTGINAAASTAAALGSAASSGAVSAGEFGAGAAGLADVGTASVGSALPSALGSIVGGVATAMPYYALAKTGGAVINATVANNPYLEETPYGRLGGSLEEPLAVEQYWGKEAAEHGIGDEEKNKIASDTLSPVGGATLGVQDGDWTRAGESLIGGITGQMSGGFSNVVRSLFGGKK